MIAYKFTGAGGTTYDGFRWPLPAEDGPGEWVEVGERARKALTERDLCTSRVLHATDATHLLGWLNAELWAVEIDESHGLVIGPDKIGFRRGRLLYRIERWNDRTARLFACDCAEDALKYADPDSRETLECAIYVARCFADGAASEADLDAAWDAARAAAWDAARAAARAAAWDAARAAARDAAWAAAGAKYTGWLCERLGIVR
jgi:hypothetical protein